MINIINKISKKKVNLLIGILLVVLSGLTVYFLGFSFGPDISPESTRISINSENVIAVKEEVVGKFSVSKVEKVKNDDESLGYNLYLIDEEKEQKEDIKVLLGTMDNVQYEVDSVHSLIPINAKSLVQFFVFLNILGLVIIWLAGRNIFGNKKSFILWLISTDMFYFVVIMYIGILSLLSSFGWQITEFTLNISVILGILILLFSTFYIYDFIVHLKGEGVGSLESLYMTYLQDTVQHNSKLLLVISVFVATFAIIYDFRVEVLLLIGSIWLTYLAYIFMVVPELSFADKFLKKKKSKKSNKKNNNK